MKLVDAGKMLPNGQAQGISGLNNNPIKAEAEAEVREQQALVIIKSVLQPSSFFLHIAISHIICFLLLSSSY
jgi:hypothetical protein